MIVFAWEGFPQYAARCVGALVKAIPERVFVVATRPQVPIEGMEQSCGCDVKWIGSGEAAWGIKDIERENGEKISALFVSGWGISAFNKMAVQVRVCGGSVFCMLDNNYRFSLREMIKAIRFRMKFRGRYDGFFVPGKSSRRLLRFYGVANDRIVEGLYAADESLFHDGRPLGEREKKIIYVGQFIERKNIYRFAQAFKLANERKEWTLELYGSGALKSVLQSMVDEQITVHDFCQPVELAERYRSARAFCLPSLDEHWGVVVHEAALSGCVLLLSDCVGAKEDLLEGNNGFQFDPMNEISTVGALRRMMQMTDDEMNRAYETSLRMAGKMGLSQFVAGVRQLMKW